MNSHHLVYPSQRTGGRGTYREEVNTHPQRCHQTKDSHFITFSCSKRYPLLHAPASRSIFEEQLERCRQWYGFYVFGYVVMPEHVHLLLSEPERTTLSRVMQMLKQEVAKRLNWEVRLWLPRYYDFNVHTHKKHIEKLRYIHRNPVKRGLVSSPELWQWSSYRHYLTGEEGTVEIESEWTGRKREKIGIFPTVKVCPRETFESNHCGCPTLLRRRGWAERCELRGVRPILSLREKDGAPRFVVM